MRLLRYIGPGNGADPAEMLIVEDTDDGQQFGLVLDDALRCALAPAQSLATGAVAAVATGPEPAAPRPAQTAQPLTPREIQVRVRAGETPEQLAAETGVSPDRIARFAYAVLQERLRVGAEARRARARRGGPDGEMQPFGETVDTRFEQHGISAQAIAWDAVRDGDGPWTVIARWRSGDVESSARWSFLLGARTVVPDDDTAMELLSDRPVQRHHGVPLTMVAVPVSPADGEPDSADESGNLRRLPVRGDDQFFDQEAFNDGQAPREPVAPAAAFGGLRAVPNPSRPAPTTPPTALPTAPPTTPPPSGEPAPAAPALGAFFDSATAEPTLPLDLGDSGRLPFDLPGDRDPAPQRALIEAEDLIEAHDLPPRAPAAPEPVNDPDAEDEQSSRARIPSWDDILLGVRRKRD
jgi:hypothetical protein